MKQLLSKAYIIVLFASSIISLEPQEPLEDAYYCCNGYWIGRPAIQEYCFDGSQDPNSFPQFCRIIYEFISCPEFYQHTQHIKEPSFVPFNPSNKLDIQQITFIEVTEDDCKKLMEEKERATKRKQEWSKIRKKQKKDEKK